MCALKAGDRVYLIHNKDQRGTVAVQACTIRAAGKSQITMYNADGARHRRAYHPDHINALNFYHYILKAENVPNIEAIALEIAADWIAVARERFKRTLGAATISAQYRKSVEAQVRELHEPRIEWLDSPVQPADAGAKRRAVV